LNRFDKVFNSTTKLLFNSEFGHSLLSLKEYLTRMIPKPKIKKAGDGSFVYFSSPFYSDSANYISFNKQKPNSNSHISIDDLKDLDSLLGAVGENFSFCGNYIYGNSSNVVDSDSCENGVNISNSYQVLEYGKYIVYSYGIRASNYIFGSAWSGSNDFLIRCQGLFFSKLCFESYLSNHSSNLYFSFNCTDCNESLFSFNQSSKRYIIGNTSLEKSKYYSIKEKLLSEFIDEFKKNKSFPSLFDFVGGE